MYVTNYKINNSYTTYVVLNSESDEYHNYFYRKSTPKLEWKKGAKVSHYFYGIGKICGITNNQVTVHFKNNKSCKKFKNVQVSFELKNKPDEIESIKLCF